MHVAPKEQSEAISEYRAFIEDYPDSALAEVAYGRLVAMDGISEDWSSQKQLKSSIARISRSYQSHQEALQRHPAQTVVAPIAFSEAEEPSANRRILVRRRTKRARQSKSE